MTQLHQVVAKQRSVWERTRKELTDLYRIAQHPPMFMGSTRAMVSSSEDIPDDPPEISLPPFTAAQIFQRMTKILTESWDMMATRDRSNMDAKADIVLDGQILAEGVPVATLLSLEKQLTDMRTVISSIPVRDPSKVWEFDPDQEFHRAPEVRKAKTRKVMKALLLVAATKEHQGKAEAHPADEIVGHYITTEFSGAVSSRERQALVDRVNAVIDAVKEARTEANKTEVTDVRLGAKLLGYVFAR